jgi:hypothetical protein
MISIGHMKQTSRSCIQPKVGECCRLHVHRQGHRATHLVLILASTGEWCTILDLQAYGQPNPAASEKLRWTNAHAQFERLPRSEWPPAARRLHAVAGWTAPVSRAPTTLSRSTGRNPMPAPMRLTLNVGTSAGRAATVSPETHVVVTAA